MNSSYEEIKITCHIVLIRQLPNHQFSLTSTAYAKEFFTINEVSELMKIPKSTIRYWEQAGYVAAYRDPENHYRCYVGGYLLKMRLIQVLQNSVYSEKTVKFKQSIAAVEHLDLQSIMKLAENIRSYLDKGIESQMYGISRLYNLIQLIKAPI